MRRLAALLLAAACSPAPSPIVSLDTPPAYDHHVHLLGESLLRDWQSLGIPFSRPDSAYLSVTAALAEGGSSHAFLVSMAHIYGSEEFREALALSVDDEAERVRRANEHIAVEAARDPSRYVGFCSVHPLRPYAMDELRRCSADVRFGGLKLHVPNSGLRLTDSTHLALLAGIVAEAARERRHVLIHVGGEEDVSAEGVARLLREVIAPANGLSLQFAHLGGGGGYAARSRLLLQQLPAFLENNPGGVSVAVDLSAAALAQETDGVAASSEEDMLQLAQDLRALGLERVHYASDYPALASDRYPRELRQLLPLSDEEWKMVLSNRSRAFARGGEGERR